MPRERDSASAAFNDSLGRCLEHPRFLERFYEIFLAMSPEVREAFADTDFTRQTRMLRASLYVVMSAGSISSGVNEQLERLATRHHALGVRKYLYGLWLTALLHAVAEHDPRFDEEIEQAWRSTLRVGVEFMKRGAPS